MNLLPIKEIFDIEYGNQFDLNKLEINAKNKNISFVSRTSKNNGVSEWVKPYQGVKSYNKGLITVSLGGTYLLSSFVQQFDFYTAQNIKVLTPKTSMSLDEKLFYCAAIKHNRFRYTSHGREANKTFNDLLVPSREDALRLIKKVKTRIPKPSADSLTSNVKLKLSDRNWVYFNLSDYFIMNAGKYYPKESYVKGNTPLVTASDQNNGVLRFTNLTPVYVHEHITIGKIGASTFFHNVPFCASSDVTILSPKKSSFNSFIGIFISTLINKENFRWNYGRQIRLGDCEKMKIKLPVNKEGDPDWQFMDKYIKSLPYSGNLA